MTSAEHWAERYDLILIIALGESVISVGVGSNLIGRPPSWPAVTSAVLGIVFTAALWWAHYDWVGPGARIALHAAEGRHRVTMARDAPPGEGFPADVCRVWKAATRPAEDAGVRVARLRTGLPLHRDGGMRKPQLPPFKLGIAGEVGQRPAVVAVDGYGVGAGTAGSGTGPASPGRRR